MSETTLSRSEGDRSSVVKAVFQSRCLYLVPKLQNSAFLLRIFKIAGAEGGLDRLIPFP